MKMAMKTNTRLALQAIYIMVALVVIIFIVLTFFVKDEGSGVRYEITDVALTRAEVLSSTSEEELNKLILEKTQLGVLKVNPESNKKEKDYIIKPSGVDKNQIFIRISLSDLMEKSKENSSGIISEGVGISFFSGEEITGILRLKIVDENTKIIHVKGDIIGSETTKQIVNEIKNTQEKLKSIEKEYREKGVSVPENKGYIFTGWYFINDQGKEELFSFDNEISRDYKLYAKWVEEIDTSTLVGENAYKVIEDGKYKGDSVNQVKTKRAYIFSRTGGEIQKSSPGERIRENVATSFFYGTESVIFIILIFSILKDVITLKKVKRLKEARKREYLASFNK